MCRIHPAPFGDSPRRADIKLAGAEAKALSDGRPAELEFMGPALSLAGMAAPFRTAGGRSACYRKGDMDFSFSNFRLAIILIVIAVAIVGLPELRKALRRRRHQRRAERKRRERPPEE